MNALTEKIRKGRQKGKNLRRNKIYNKIILDYRKFNTESIESCNKLESAYRWAKVCAVIAVIGMLFGFYQSVKYFDLIGELNTEYKELIEMQIEANESLAQANELIELVEKNEELDEEIKNLVDSVLEKNDRAEDFDPEMKTMSAAMRLLEFMNKSQTEDGSIYCPLCNRKI